MWIYDAFFPVFPVSVMDMTLNQHILASFAINAQFVSFSTPSRAARKAGLKNRDVIGKRIWDFAPPGERDRIEAAFARCLIHGEPQIYVTSSALAGSVEHWETTLLPANGGHVVCLGREILPTAAPGLEPDEKIIMSMICDDLSLEQVAKRLKCHANTLAAKLKRLRDRFGVHTNTGLVAYCVRFEMV